MRIVEDENILAVLNSISGNRHDGKGRGGFYKGHPCYHICKQHTKEAREKISKARKGIKISLDIRRRISETVSKKYKEDKDYRVRVSEGTKKAMSKPEVRRRYVEGIKKRGKNPNWRKNVSSGVLKRYKSHPETLDKIREARMRQIFPKQDTKIEVVLQKALRNKGLIFKTHYPIIGQPDIAFVEKKVAIFCDGCYWHGCPIHYPNRKRPIDDEITKELEKSGWKVLRYRECEIVNNLEEIVLEITEVVG